MRLAAALTLLWLAVPPAAAAAAAAANTVVAFGSCSKTTEKQPMWDVLHSRPAPDAFIFAGDNIYADVNMHPLRSPTSTEGLLAGERPRFVPSSREEHKKMYDAQRLVPGYARLVQSTSTVLLSTWDDHDAGINDADRYFAFKDERQSLFLDFFDVPEDSPRRKRKGVYNSHVLTDAKGRTVKIILLDVRYHRDPWPWHVGGIDAASSDVLGDDQWAWLDAELTGDDSADISLLVSGFQVLPITLLDRTKHESWWHFTGARQRLLDLLHRSRGPALLLSGDVHFAEVSACVCSSKKRQSRARKIVEFTSSGLTHAWAGPLNWPRPLAMALVFRCAWYLWDWLGVSPWRIAAFPNLNYGEIEVDHDERIIHLRVVDQNGLHPIDESFAFDLLPGGGQGDDFVGVPCKPVNGEPSPARLLMARATMAAVPIGAVLAALAGLVFLARSTRQAFSIKSKMVHKNM